MLAGAAQLPRSEGVLIDATLGGGGHSALLLEHHPGLRLIGLDQDPTARAAAAERLAPFGDRVLIEAANFADYVPSEPALMVLADLGVSSPQLDVAERGFSFRLDGPLDMRMNSAVSTETAAPRPSLRWGCACFFLSMLPASLGGLPALLSRVFQLEYLPPGFWFFVFFIVGPRLS